MATKDTSAKSVDSAKSVEDAKCVDNKKDEAVEEINWDQNQVANSVIKRHTALAAGAGAVPVPVGDIVALIGVQLNMIKRLCDTYDVEFSKGVGRNAIMSLVGTMIPHALRTSVVSLIKVIPGVGSYAGAAAMPALNATTTYALGKVFVKHFESGGTLLDFDAPKAREYFKKQIEGAPQQAAA